ncbi:hypothetical protein H6P81_016695 [Aristolochia fimbriata]|uniref:Uncharacterized protein n=1 Tax=Aristolochia fimbriata TaxID=158543 RepID=A0AAV7E921_ARIFI|nr:hypothetical protein H6P81_016695 [Aristolochia fimbriata]
MADSVQREEQRPELVTAHRRAARTLLCPVSCTGTHLINGDEYWSKLSKREGGQGRVTVLISPKTSGSRRPTQFLAVMQSAQEDVAPEEAKSGRELESVKCRQSV